MSIVAQSRKWLGKAVKPVLNALLPASCLLCGAHCGEGMLCPDCRNDLPRLGPDACPRCAEPGSGGLPCAHCQRQQPHFDGAWAAWRYEHPVDRLVQALKYQAQLGLADLFAQTLALSLAPAASQWDALVPLPLHGHRMAERGFNQSLEIARRLGSYLNLPVQPDACLRLRATATQADLPEEKRHGNVRNAFHCPRDMQGMRLLLVDDVLTTGATLSECARTLKLHGALRVEVAVVARTPQQAQEHFRQKAST